MCDFKILKNNPQDIYIFKFNSLQHEDKILNIFIVPFQDYNC